MDNFKKYVTSVSCILEPMIQSFDTGQQIPFQLIITWMSNTKLNTDSIVSYASDLSVTFDIALHVVYRLSVAGHTLNQNFLDGSITKFS